MRVLLLNGPPGSGKDTLAEMLCSQLIAVSGGDWVLHTKFAWYLKQATHRLYGIPNPDDIHQFEKNKEEPNKLFFGLSPRQAYIAVSEDFFKKVHGIEFFGDMLVRRLALRLTTRYVVVSDCGFKEEVLPVIEALGRENVRLVRLHREGCSFEGDSRSHLDLSAQGVPCLDIHNRGSFSDLMTDTKPCLDFLTSPSKSAIDN